MSNNALNGCSSSPSPYSIQLDGEFIGLLFSLSSDHRVNFPRTTSSTEASIDEILSMRKDDDGCDRMERCSPFHQQSFSYVRRRARGKGREEKNFLRRFEKKLCNRKPMVASLSLFIIIGVQIGIVRVTTPSLDEEDIRENGKGHSSKRTDPFRCTLSFPSLRAEENYLHEGDTSELRLTHDILFSCLRISDTLRSTDDEYYSKPFSLIVIIIPLSLVEQCRLFASLAQRPILFVLHNSSTSSIFFSLQQIHVKSTGERESTTVSVRVRRVNKSLFISSRSIDRLTGEQENLSVCLSLS